MFALCFVLVICGKMRINEKQQQQQKRQPRVHLQSTLKIIMAGQWCSFNGVDDRAELQLGIPRSSNRWTGGIRQRVRLDILGARGAGRSA